MNTREIYRSLVELPESELMPAMFVGHGNPMNAVSDNVFSRAWEQLGRVLPKPSAILCVSAHWLTPGSTKVTAMDVPRTIHDFGGFPRVLFEQQYPAPGSPEYAARTIELIRKAEVISDYQWGLDHGTWSVLIRMFPKADVPVYQLSIDYAKPAEYHYDLAQELALLRKRGVLLIGSGNVVHNLSAMKWDESPYDWAVEFDEVVASLIDRRDDEGIVKLPGSTSLAKMAHPTLDHLLPLLYVLSVKSANESIEYFNDEFDLSSISMRSFVSRLD